MNRIKGIIYGMISGASFGLIPLFTLPLFASGLQTDSVLFYRFSVAAIIIGVTLLIKRESFRITSTQLIKLIALGFFYMSSALFLLWGYEYMAAGIATTIHFLYPICVMLLMIIFFKERISIINFGAVIIAILGVVLLSGGDGSTGGASLLSIIIVLISSMAYAFYIIGVKKLNLGALSGLKLTFYVLLFTAIMFLVKALLFGDGITMISNSSQIFNIVLLALVPTVVSNYALVNAINIVGSTTTSILGALEPLTAVIIGVTVFDEPMSLMLVFGIAMIILAITTIVLNKAKSN